MICVGWLLIPQYVAGLFLCILYKIEPFNFSGYCLACVMNMLSGMSPLVLSLSLLAV